MHPRQAMMLKSRFSPFTLGPGECAKITLINQRDPRFYATTKEEALQAVAKEAHLFRVHRRSVGLDHKRMEERAVRAMGIERKGPDPRTKKGKGRSEKEKRIAKYYGMK